MLCVLGFLCGIGETFHSAKGLLLSKQRRAVFVAEIRDVEVESVFKKAVGRDLCRAASVGVS